VGPTTLGVGSGPSTRGDDPAEATTGAVACARCSPAIWLAGWRRGWDLNPRWVAPHTISNRADSAALAPLRALLRLAWSGWRAPAPSGAGCGGRALRNGAPQTGSGPDGSSPQRAAPCAVGSLTAAPGIRGTRSRGASAWQGNKCVPGGVPERRPASLGALHVGQRGRQRGWGALPAAQPG
jgi:hypothetical protein